MAAFDHLRKADGILFTGSPPFLIHFLVPLKFLFKGRLVYRITDFHPECLIAARDRPSLALGLLQSLTNLWRRRIDAFEVLGLDQWQRLRDLGVPDERISLVRDGSPVVFSKEQAAEPLPAELEGKCVLLYSGNFIAHEVETVAQGYQMHHRTGSGRCISGSMRHRRHLAVGSIVRRRRAVCSAPVPLGGWLTCCFRQMLISCAQTPSSVS